ncbi:MAG: hypothetical protein WCT04_08915 [Planctomycetota bacterium]
MIDRTFFDAYSLFDPNNASASTRDGCGRVVFGRGVSNCPGALRAEVLNCIVGSNDPRYPLDADVVDLCLDDATMVDNLREPPSHWWPLCGAARANENRLVIHINADDFGSLAKGMTRLARAFPTVHFFADPFLKGKVARWQAGVCLAEEPNVWITTRGLYASPATWPDRSEREAIHFTVGEVGAGKLLFASGLTPALMDAQLLRPDDWLSGISFLEPAQCDLILRKNAGDAFADLGT